MTLNHVQIVFSNNGCRCLNGPPFKGTYKLGGWYMKSTSNLFDQNVCVLSRLWCFGGQATRSAKKNCRR